MRHRSIAQPQATPNAFPPQHGLGRLFRGNACPGERFSEDTQFDDPAGYRDYVDENDDEYGEPRTQRRPATDDCEWDEGRSDEWWRGDL